MTAPESAPQEPATAETFRQPGEVYATALREYSDEAAAGIGRLMPYLDPKFSSEPTPRERLEYIINSPDYEQLVAYKDGEIVGVATMTRIREPGFDGMGYLGGFVVDPEAQGGGIGDKIWDAMGTWCRQNGLSSFEFKTETYREAAVRFYDKHGAHRVEEAILYEKDVTPDGTGAA